jgi:cytochrome c5
MSDADAAVPSVPDGAGVTPIEYFEAHVKPILDQTCAACHATGVVNAPQFWAASSATYASLVGSSSLVAPGDPDRSCLLWWPRSPNHSGPTLAGDSAEAFVQWLQMEPPTGPSCRRPCGGEALAQPPPVAYLSRDGVGDTTSATAYYQGIGADTTQTLDQWVQSRIGAGPTNHAVYRNTMDLGFVREMTCSTTLSRGQGGCWVRNWKTFDDQATGNLTLNVGTVAMDVDAHGITRFYAFGSAGTMITAVALDSEGPKALPQVCTVCHGGGPHKAGFGADQGALFREFEPSLLEKRPTIDQATAEAEWLALNQSVKSANLAVRSEVEGSPPGVDATRASIVAYLDEIYGGATTGRPVGDPTHLPASWPRDATTTALWEKVVAPFCMGCHHVSTAPDLRDYKNFKQLAVDDGGTPLLRHYFAGQGVYRMPHAEVTVQNLTASTDATAAIDAWLATTPCP